MTDKVFKDSGAPLAAYATEAICICPNCNGPAIAKGQSKYAIPLWIDKARVQCTRCSFTKEYDDQQWHGPMIGYARQRCPHCGHKWLQAELRRIKSPQVKQEARVRCNGCGRDSEVRLNWYREDFSGKPYDPYFGLPLWLQSDCCGKTFWAYNEKHLNTLRSYIGATHRQRPSNGKWSMFTRLPQWIKAAKNRDELLKCVTKLERRLKKFN